MMAVYDVTLFPRSSCFIRKIDGNIFVNSRCDCFIFFVLPFFLYFFFPTDIEMPFFIIKKFSASVTDSDQKIEETFVVLHELGLDELSIIIVCDVGQIVSI